MFFYPMLMGQRTITFPSKDGTNITADIYETSSELPYILLFHQAGSSRGEYKYTAKRFTKFGYNCMSVDLRTGQESNYVTNETARMAREKKLSTSYLDAIPDMQATIEYATKISRKKVVIVGSSFSASLALLLSTKNPQIAAIIAFSPGEYFEPSGMVRDSIKNLNIPIWIGGTRDELPYLKELVSKVDPSYVTLFIPQNDKGKYGSMALWDNNPSKDEYWLSLLLFFNQIKE